MSKLIPLPIDEYLADIATAFQSSKNLILSAEPGAGKTTRVPFSLLPSCPGQILVLEPRRLAAVSSASRVCEEQQLQLGSEVGYQVRFENCYSKNTKLIYITEALLIRKMLTDPDLRDVSCVILDEFHERSLHTDLSLTLLFELQQLSRPDLKIVVMSATLDTAPLQKYLQTESVFQVPGKSFPLEIKYEDKVQLLRSGPELAERIGRLTRKALAEVSAGDALVFLPGLREIRLTQEWFEKNLQSDFELQILHGQLSLDEQRQILSPQSRKRRIILSTNIAESSLTVPGVKIVVDSGLMRIAEHNQKTGLLSLDLQRISKASAIQRAGRAARQSQGFAYRAWTSHDEISMKDFETPELFRSDLSEVILLLSALGLTNPSAISWFEAPEPLALKNARNFLIDLEALSADGHLTALGNKMRELPVSPRLAKLLVLSSELGSVELGATLSTLLSERSSRSSAPSEGLENDLYLTWEQWSQRPSQFYNFEQNRKQLLSLIKNKSATKKFDFLEQSEELLLPCFLDRLCRRRKSSENKALMTGGRGVTLHPSSSVQKSKYFLALEIQEDPQGQDLRVLKAIGISDKLIEKLIKPLAKPIQQIEWNSEKKRFEFCQFLEWKGLQLSGEDRRPATSDEIGDQLVKIVIKNWGELCQKNIELKKTLDRLELLQTLLPEIQSKELSPIAFLSPDEFNEFLEQACFSENSLESIYNKDLLPFLNLQLSNEIQNQLQKNCPTHWQVPSGSRLQIQYSKEQGPFCEVRLQELFGLSDSPIVAHQKLTLFLLAPNYRPVQVTRDLSSFWKNGYPDVKKELKTRYPKHSWPDNPLTAPPVAKGRSTK